MSIKDNRVIANAVILATAVEVTRGVVRNLDGRGLEVKENGNTMGDDMLCHLIVSRINNNIDLAANK